ncbi:MAG: hypothetical protein LBM12_01905 [Candidatus Nomurabacteria bacterium]|jgi:hypothetical protein|nr:hypothetical protein [Candidatus Nomurabacteria bacterium]
MAIIQRQQGSEGRLAERIARELRERDAKRLNNVLDIETPDMVDKSKYVTDFTRREGDAARFWLTILIVAIFAGLVFLMSKMGTA